MVILQEKSDETDVHIKNEKKKIQCGKLCLSRKGLFQETAEAIQKISILNYNVQKTD